MPLTPKLLSLLATSAPRAGSSSGRAVFSNVPATAAPNRPRQARSTPSNPRANFRPVYRIDNSAPDRGHGRTRTAEGLVATSLGSAGSWSADVCGHLIEREPAAVIEPPKAAPLNPVLSGVRIRLW